MKDLDKNNIKLRIQFTTFTAKNYLDKDGCSAINKNDYLGKVIFYNGQGNQIKDAKYTVIVFFFGSGGESDPVIIKFDKTTDSLWYDFQG
jgi:hypothetical protein